MGEESQEEVILQNIILVYEQFGDKFADDIFGPCSKSLYCNSKCPMLDTEDAMVKHTVTQWLRPQQIRDDDHSRTEWTVFDSPHPHDIVQGSLGNCWLLSALAVLSERDDLVKKVIGITEK